MITNETADFLDVQDAIAKILSHAALCVIAFSPVQGGKTRVTRRRLEIALNLRREADNLVALFSQDDNFGENVHRDFDVSTSLLDDSFFGGFTKED